MRIVFMGTPEFAVPVLTKLVDQGEQVLAVVTQPDRPVGRGRRTLPPPTKQAALRLGIPVLQPNRMRDAEVVEELRELAPELVVVAAFGQILPRSVLAIPRYGCLNVHASLLPRHRGAAPINAAILAGDADAGVTIMVMEPGLDTGPMLTQAKIAIRPDDTADSLGKRLAELGAALLVDTLPRWVAGKLPSQPQDEAGASYAPVLRREQGLVDWTQPAEAISRQCRAYYPWPGCYTYWNGKVLKILRATPVPGWHQPGYPAGKVVKDGRRLLVATGAGALALEQLQLEGKRPMSGEEFLNGHGAVVGAVLG